MFHGLEYRLANDILGMSVIVLECPLSYVTSPTSMLESVWHF